MGLELCTVYSNSIALQFENYPKCHQIGATEASYLFLKDTLGIVDLGFDPNKQTLMEDLLCVKHHANEAVTLNLIRSNLHSVLGDGYFPNLASKKNSRDG